MHAVILFLILTPIFASSEFTHEPTVGGGGPGPAGGGGGGSAASASSQERLEFIRVRPSPAATPKVTTAIPPVKPPEVRKPEPAVTSTPQPTSDPMLTPAAGEGTGATGTPGAGPGTGGGIGSGVGTGTGSSVGPGTGGGPAKDYPATIRDLFLPPQAPARIKPYHMVAWFDVDEKGNASLISFNPSRDGGFNRKLAEVLRELKFRPGTRADGTPMRDTAEVHFVF